MNSEAKPHQGRNENRKIFSHGWRSSLGLVNSQGKLVVSGASNFMFRGFASSKTGGSNGGRAIEGEEEPEDEDCKGRWACWPRVSHSVIEIVATIARWTIALGRPVIAKPMLTVRGSLVEGNDGLRENALGIASSVTRSGASPLNPSQKAPAALGCFGEGDGRGARSAASG